MQDEEADEWEDREWQAEAAALESIKRALEAQWARNPQRVRMAAAGAVDGQGGKKSLLDKCLTEFEYEETRRLFADNIKKDVPQVCKERKTDTSAITVAVNLVKETKKRVDSKWRARRSKPDQALPGEAAATRKRQRTDALDRFDDDSFDGVRQQELAGGPPLPLSDAAARHVHQARRRDGTSLLFAGVLLPSIPRTGRPADRRPGGHRGGFRRQTLYSVFRHFQDSPAFSRARRQL